MLHLHRELGGDEALAAVDVRAKAHALLVDREDRALPAAAAPTLDLVGDRPVPEREDLEAPRVGDDRPLPAHEPVQPAEALDQLTAGSQVQVEGVAEDHLEAECQDLLGNKSAHAGRARERHERGRSDRPVGGFE